MATNIEITEQLNKAIQEQNELYAKQLKMLKGQAQLLEQMVQTTQNIDPSSIMGGSDAWEKTRDAIEESIEKTGEYGESVSSQAGIANKALGKFGLTAKDTGKKLEKVGKAGMAIGLIAGVVGKVTQAFDLMGTTVSVAFGILGKVFGLIENLSISVITAPFKILDALIGNIQGGSSELRQALEDIRKEFGSLHTGASKAIISISRSMQGQLAKTGLSTYRIFGNIAEKLKTITEYAQKLGPLFSNLSAGLLKNSEAFGAYVKGLGLTDEGMKGVGRQALIFGKDFTEVGRQITGMAYQLGPAFGINGKEISRAIGDMMADVKSFGSLSVKQLGQIAVYTRKLGMEFKDLLGIIDKFDNFEDAANSVAQLTQAFGLNLDAFDLMQDQDPASRFEKIRKAFFQTGRSVENMTRQELKLLASQTGLNEESVKLGFSMKSQGMTYDQVQKKAAIAEKKQLSQAEAMKALADSIERLVKSGATPEGGFFDRFIQGFMRGVQMSKEFRQMMYSLQRVLWIVYRAGMQVGREFVKFFPGVKGILGGMRELFSPQMWRKSMAGVVKVFRTFFQDIGSDPQKAVKNLLNGIQSVFEKHFKSSGPGASKLIEGFKNFLQAIIRGGTQLLVQGVTGLVDIIKNVLTNGISGDVTNSVSGSLTGFSKFIAGEFSYIGDTIRKSGLFDKVIELFHLIIAGVKRFFKSDAGQQLLAGFNDLIAAIKPGLVKAIIDIGKEIGKAFIKAIADGMFRSTGIMMNESENAFKRYSEGLKKSGSIEELRRQLSRPVPPEELFGDATQESVFSANKSRIEEWYSNQLSELQTASDAAHEAAQHSSGILNAQYTKRWQEIETTRRQLQREATAAAADADRIYQREFANSQTDMLRTASATLNTIEEQTRAQDALRAGLRATDTDYLKAQPGRQGPATSGPASSAGPTAESVQHTIGSQAEAIAAVEEFGRVKRMRLPTESEMTKFADKMTVFLDTWKTKVAGALKGFNKGWSDSVLEQTTDLVAAVNQVTDEFNKVTGLPRQVRVDLQKLGDMLGMKGTSTLLVKNRNFSFTVNVDVHIDAEELEDTLLNRYDTRIVHIEETGEPGQHAPRAGRTIWQG